MTPASEATPVEVPERAPADLDLQAVRADRFSQPVSEARLARTVGRLTANGFDVKVVHSKSEAVQAVQAMIPSGAEVLNNTSATLDATGITELIMNSGGYRPIRPELMRLREANDRDGMRRRGSAPEFVVGSVHAITESGQVVIASATGSQLAPYSYGAAHVIWVVGTQKIVTDLDEAFQRIDQHSLPLESDRVRSAYGMLRSAVNQVLIVNGEMSRPPRASVILLTEAVGF